MRQLRSLARPLEVRPTSRRVARIGYQHGGRDDSPETLFDGAVFDPKDPEGYAKSFAVKSLKGDVA